MFSICLFLVIISGVVYIFIFLVGISFGYGNEVWYCFINFILYFSLDIGIRKWV